MRWNYFKNWLTDHPVPIAILLFLMFFSFPVLSIALLIAFVVIVSDTKKQRTQEYIPKKKMNAAEILILSALITFFSVAFLAQLYAYGTGQENSSSSSSPTASTSSKQDLSTDAKIKYNVISESYTINTTSYETVYMECCIVVENTGNKNLYLGDTDLDIEDVDGHLVDVCKNIDAYPNVIAPGEKAVIYDVFSFDGNANDTYHVEPTFDIQKATVPIERLPVSDVSVKENKYGYIEVVGRVKNTTEKEQSLYRLAVILYDSKDHVISVIDTYPDSLKPDQQTSFATSNIGDYVDVSYSDIVRWEVIAFTRQWQFD